MKVYQLRKYFDLENDLYDSCTHPDYEDACEHLAVEISMMVDFENSLNELILDEDGERQYKIVDMEMTEEEYNNLGEFEGF